MELTRRVRLRGEQLDEIDNRILIQSVEPQAGKDQRTTAQLWSGIGSRVTAEHRDWLEVKVTFSLRMKRDAYAERAEVLEKIITWAAPGGWLQISQKPGRRLRVILDQLPAEGDALARHFMGNEEDQALFDELLARIDGLLESGYQEQVVFRAYGIPYWQDTSADGITINGTSGAKGMEVRGNARTAVDFEFKNTSTGTINTFDITAGESRIALQNLGLLSGETLLFDHNDNGRRSVVRIRIRSIAGNYRSVLECRTPQSSDDLYVEPGQVNVIMNAQRKGTLTAEARGRWL